MAESADQLYDGWKAARRRGWSWERYAAHCGMSSEELRDHLEGLLVVENAMPASSLASSALQEETVFAGFRMLEWLGEGGTGVVYLARDERADSPTFDRLVALKVANPLLCAVAARRELLLREARVVQSLNHAGIVTVVDCGVERGWTWIATEYFDGKRLDQLEPLSERRALELLLQLLRALEHAHSKGIVHRDLKPGNVLVDASDRVKVLDFGLARTAAEPLTISGTGAIVGTPHYMAPEQAQAQPDVDPRTDLHACGLLLWELMTGKRCTQLGGIGPHLERLARRRRALPLRQLRGLPPSSKHLIERCTRPDPRDRPMSASTLAAEVEAALQGRSVAADWKGRTHALCRAAVQSPTLRYGLPLSGLLALALYRFGPVPVQFQTVRGGKLVEIDGKARGISPLHTWLLPGEHSWRASFGSGIPCFAGTIEVQHGRTNHFLEVLQPSHGVPELEAATLRAEEPGAWVQISTPLPKVDLEIDGKLYPGIHGICSVRLPLGTHSFTILAPGYVPRSETLELGADRLHSLSYELDQEDSPWTTTLIYSAIEHSYTKAIRSSRNARMIWENGVIGNTGLSAERVYLTPEQPDEEAVIDLEVTLPSGWRELDLELLSGPQFTGPSAWSKISMGPSFTQLVEMAEYSMHAPRDWSRELNYKDNVQYMRPADSRMENLQRGLAGRSSLCIRLSAGGAPRAASVGWAQILRTEMLPLRPAGGDLRWAPAIRIRTKN
ncbi:MAG: Serine/threonine-protein kinase PrkC [Planctomycetota bacterium]